MALNDRSMGYELSNVEREIACNPKYENVGYVRHDKADGYFFLDYSPNKRNDRDEIYYSYGPRPPEGLYVEVRVEDEKYHFFDYFDDRWVKIKKISAWKEFDVSEIARKRKIMDSREIIEFFTYPYRGESDEVLRIARCSCLFACSAPPVLKDTGGISSAVFGKPYQWEMFKKPLNVIPPELRRVSSEVYYLISKSERTINKNRGEINRAIFDSETLASDIPIVIESVSKRNFLKDYLDGLEGAASIIRAQLLDSILIQPEKSPEIEKAMIEAVYAMRSDYTSDRRITYRQNIGDAIPKLAASYARLQSSPDIDKKYIEEVMKDWQFMHDKALRMETSPLRIRKPFAMTDEAWDLYYKLYDTFGSNYLITQEEGLKATGSTPEEYAIALDSIVENGLGVWKKQSIVLLDP